MKASINYRSKLEDAIAVLYKTFAVYSLRSYIEGCPCCVTENDQKLIQYKTLKELTSEELNYFAFKSMSTWGTVLDFKHFLPRLLELIAFDEQNFFWSETIIRSKLKYAKFNKWQAEEKAAVEEYLVCLWSYILANYPSLSIEPSEFIDSVAEVFEDLTLWLDIWQNHQSINALLHLSNFIENVISFNSLKLKLEIIDLSSVQIEQLFTWLLRSQIVKKLERAFFNNIESAYADQLANAIDILKVAIASKPNFE